jgi:hypothetical protein
MKQVLFAITFLLMVSLNASAQREVFFSTISCDSVSIYNTQGIFIGPAVFHGGVGVSFDIGYFKERKMTNTTSLILGGNLYAGKYIKSVINAGYNNRNSFLAPIYAYGYGCGLSFFAEPRWYFSFKNRYEKGRNVKLNTGWFLGIPLELNTNTLFADSTKVELNLQLTPVLGYRVGFSKHFFMETDFGVGISLFHLPRFQLNSYLRIKAAYTFK